MGLLGDKMVNPDNSEFQVADWYSQAESKGLKYIGLYYGAHWAPPSRLYTTNLKEKFWDPVKAGDSKDLIDIIFVSDDREINHFKRNIAKMPWCSIPFEAELTKQSLKSKFNLLNFLRSPSSTRRPVLSSSRTQDRTSSR